MTFWILQFCGSLFANFVFYDFCHGQLKPRIRDRKQVFLILLLCAAASRAVIALQNGLATLASGVLILVSQMLLLFQDDRKKELFLLLVGETVALSLELATDIFFVGFPPWIQLLETWNLNREAGDFILGALSYTFCWLVLRGLKLYFLRTKCAIGERFPLSFFVLPLATALIYLGTFFSKVGGKWAIYSQILGYILLPAANILLFYTIHNLFYISEKNREQQLAEQQATLQQRYYQHLEEIDLGHKRYAHDLKNCMASIGALAAAGGNEEIMALLKDMEVELDILTGQCYTASPVLNALLWEKEALAGRCGVLMEIKAETAPEWAGIPGRDLIIMMGNLLDNAIEAAKQCEQGCVQVGLHSEEHFLVTEIENTCGKAAGTSGGALASTKEDGENHGFGLANVRDTVKKYGGTLYTARKDGLFTAVLTVAKACLPSGAQQNLPI